MSHRVTILIALLVALGGTALVIRPGAAPVEPNCSGASPAPYGLARGLVQGLPLNQLEALDELLRGSWEAAPEGIVTHLEVNRGALAALKQGAAGDGKELTTRPFAAEQLVQVLDLTRLFALESKRLDAEGSADDALQELLQGLRFARHVTGVERPNLWSAQVGTAAESVLLPILARLVKSERCSDDALEQGLATMVALATTRPSFGTLIRGERVHVMELTLERADLSEQLTEEQRSAMQLRLEQLLERHATLGEQAWSVGHGECLVREAEAAAAKLLAPESPESMEEVLGMTAEAVVRTVLGDPVTTLRLRQHAVVQFDLALLSLAIEVAGRRRGAPLENLYPLVPELLVQIPSDPFTHDRSLRSVLMGERLVPYSVGYDGLDQKASEIAESLGDPGDCVLIY